MNKVFLIGRMTARPEVRDTKNSVVANFTLAVDRRYARDEDQTADFIRCVAFGKTAEFIEKYMDKGSKVAVCGRIQTGSYEDKDGNRHFTTDVILEEVEFAESKKAEPEPEEKTRRRR